jgi:F0F1-type ATP synthase gamma subunit
MIIVLDRGIDPRTRMSLNYTLRWLGQAWRNMVKNETIQNCYIKSTVLPGRRSSDQDQTNQDTPLDPELRLLYNEVVEKLDEPNAEEILPFEEFINPSDEDTITAEPNLDDIIVTLGNDEAEDPEHEPNEEYIFGPEQDNLSDAVVIRYLSDISLYATQREGCTDEDLASIDALMKVFTKLEQHGKKQKTLMEMGFKPI